MRNRIHVRKIRRIQMVTNRRSYILHIRLYFAYLALDLIKEKTKKKKKHTHGHFFLYTETNEKEKTKQNKKRGK